MAPIISLIRSRSLQDLSKTIRVSTSSQSLPKVRKNTLEALDKWKHLLSKKRMISALSEELESIEENFFLGYQNLDMTIWSLALVSRNLFIAGIHLNASFISMTKHDLEFLRKPKLKVSVDTLVETIDEMMDRTRTFNRELLDIQARQDRRNRQNRRTVAYIDDGFQEEDMTESEDEEDNDDEGISLISL